MRGWRVPSATWKREAVGRYQLTDVADPDQLEAAAAAVERALGPIDVWVNNAMASVFSPVKETPAAEFKRVTEVAYLGGDEFKQFWQRDAAAVAAVIKRIGKVEKP